MKKYFLVVILISFIGIILSDVSANETRRRAELIKVIDQEFSEITRLNRQNNSGSPNMLLRMAELLLEKARLIKDLENKKFMALSSERRRQVNKKSYFRGSRTYFIQAQKTCFFILKKFPRIRRKAEVYYILGANAQEFQQYKRAKKYYKRALKGSTSNRLLKIKAQLALAEMHYNDGEYKPAINLYQKALKVHEDKWWTKDTYNLAWSYFKVKKYRTAIRKMKQVYNKSGQSKFINLKDRAARDLGYFYSTAGKPGEAAKFYKRTGKDVGENLLKVGEYLMSYGKYSSAEKIFAKASHELKNNSVKKNSANIRLLELYDRSGKFYSHLVIAKQLHPAYQNNSLNNEQKKKYLFQIKKVSAILQNQVVSKTYAHNKKKRNKKAGAAIEYFKILKKVDPSKAYMYDFTIAETFFVARKYNEAIDHYDLASRQAAVVGNKKIENLANKGLIVSLDKRGISKDKKRKYTTLVYNNYLKNSPKSKEALKIYQRLFTAYMDKKNISKAEKTLLVFRRYFPYKHTLQEAMLARIMDFYKNKKDRVNFSRWVDMIKARKFIVNRNYARKLNRILMSMQFESVQGLMSKGDKKKALVSYVGIYKDPTSTAGEKKYAAYNIMLLFHELQDVKRTIGWAKRALSIMNTKDIKKFDSTFLAVGGEMFNRRKFTEAVFVYEKTLLKLCKTNSRKKKTFFKNAYIIYLADNRVEEVRNLIRQTVLCNIPQKLIDQAQLEVLKTLVEMQRWNSVEDLIGIMSKNSRMQAELIDSMNQLRKQLERNGRNSKSQQIRKQILNYYRIAKKRGYKITLKGLDVVASFKVKDLNRRIRNFTKIKLKFPEKVFNSRLQNKLVKLKSLTDSAIDILKIGSGKGLVRAYKVLVENYELIINEMRHFTPPGKSKSYVKSFKKSMMGLSRDLQKRAREFRKDAAWQIRKNNIFSNESYLFLTKTKLPIRAEYIYTPGGILMDRGGRR